MRKQLAIITLAASLVAGHAVADPATDAMLQNAPNELGFKTLNVMALSQEEAIEAVVKKLTKLKKAQKVAALVSFIQADEELALAVVEAYAARITTGHTISTLRALQGTEALGEGQIVSVAKAMLRGMKTAGASYHEMGALAAVLSAGYDELMTYIRETLGADPELPKQPDPLPGAGSEF